VAAMVLERAEITIKDGTLDEFLQVFRAKALPLTETYSGCLSFKAMQCVEYPNRVMFLAEWESIEAHRASRLEPDHTEFRNMVLPFSAGGAETVHFTRIEPLPREDKP
jgi:quinol monooxygenase YgiN